MAKRVHLAERGGRGASPCPGTARSVCIQWLHSRGPRPFLRLWHYGAMRLPTWNGSDTRNLTSIGLIVALAACAPLASLPPQKAGYTEQPPNLGPIGARNDSDLRLVLWHSPALGIKSLVKVHSTDGMRTLEVRRTLGAGFARYWTVRFVGDDIKVVDETIAGLLQAGTNVAACPRRRGRDGVIWAAMTLPDRKEFSLDFQHDGGGVDCDDFERFAVRLMHFGLLRCTTRACLRPRESSTSQFECMPGSSGDECRELQHP
jgi:hypothetical protein